MSKQLQKLFLFAILFIMSALSLNAQVVQSFNNYHLRLDQGTITATTYEVVINIASDPSNGIRQLGTSNFQILFSDQFLSNPVLSSNSLTAAYDQANASLINPGTGVLISVFPVFTEVGRIVFDITTPGNGAFLWTDNVFDTKETVVYFDDEGTLRHPVQMTDLQNTTFELDLQSFDVAWKNKNQNDAIVNWITATEDGTTSFEVERSFNAVDGWEKVGTVAARGGSNYGAEYSFEDTQVSFYMPDVLAYYRLKEINATGLPAYSDTRVLKRTLPKEQNFINTYPNPVDETLIVEFNINSFSAGSIDLYIVAADGKKVFESRFDQSQPRNISIATKDFAPGVYAVFIRQGKQSLVQKFVKKP